MKMRLMVYNEEKNLSVNDKGETIQHFKCQSRRTKKKNDVWLVLNLSSEISWR